MKQYTELSIVHALTEIFQYYIPYKDYFCTNAAFFFYLAVLVNLKLSVPIWEILILVKKSFFFAVVSEVIHVNSFIHSTCMCG